MLNHTERKSERSDRWRCHQRLNKLSSSYDKRKQIMKKTFPSKPYRCVYAQGLGASYEVQHQSDMFEDYTHSRERERLTCFLNVDVMPDPLTNHNDRIKLLTIRGCICL